MTLHQTIEVAKKFLLGAVVGVGIIIILALFFQLGIMIKNVLFPPEVQPPTYAYDVLPKIQFPQNITSDKLTYTLNTITGALPEFPDRLSIFPIQKPQPSFLNLDKAREKAAKLGFITDQGTVSPEINLGNATYQWIQNQTPHKRLTMSILSFDFTLTSNYLNLPESLESNKLENEQEAVGRVRQFLDSIELTPPDIAFEKTTDSENPASYITNPQLFSIANGVLVPSTSLSKTQVIRVDLYQKNMTYSLNTGIPEVTGGTKKLDLDIPIIYPRPPYSTMNFLVAPGSSGSEVVEANFIHQNIIIDETTEATYPIKTAQEAFDELTNGKAYIASYAGFEPNVAIINVFLAYYMGEDPQEYLMPVIVFEGNNGFFAYVSAVRDEWTK